MKKIGMIVLSVLGVFVCLFIFSVFIFNQTPLGEVVEGLTKLKNIQGR